MGDLTLFEEGVLDKKGPLKQWKKYYCTLQNSRFSYRPFKGAEATSKDLEMSTVHSVRAIRGKPGSNSNEIHFHIRGDREIVFAAYNTDDQDRWVKGLQKAIELKRKRESLRSSLINFETDRGVTVYDQPWDLEATVTQSNEKLKKSFKNPSSSSLDSHDEHAMDNGCTIVQRRVPPRIEPYAEVELYPKPKNQKDPITSLVTPYAETTINETQLAQSNGREAETLYSKCTEMKPTFSENDSSGYSYMYAQVNKPKFREEPDTSNIEKFRVSYGAYDSYTDGDSGLSQLHEVGEVVKSSKPKSRNESGKDSEAVLAALKDALGIFSGLEKYERPRSLKYPDCEKSASFVALKNHFACTSEGRFARPRSCKLGTYIQQLKKSLAVPAVQIKMEMEL